MSELQTAKNNALSPLEKLYSAPGLSWWPVIFFLPARLVFAFIAQALTAGVFAYRGSPNAWQDATAWWPVYSTITDVLCLFTLVWLTKREGIKISDLFGVKGKDILKQLAWTPAGGYEMAGGSGGRGEVVGEWVREDRWVWTPLPAWVL